jgi:hypothetical protein
MTMKKHRKNEKSTIKTKWFESQVSVEDRNKKNRLVRYESIKRQNQTRLMQQASFTFSVTHWRKYVGSWMT